MGRMALVTAVDTVTAVVTAMVTVTVVAMATVAVVAVVAAAAVEDVLFNMDMEMDIKRETSTICVSHEFQEPKEVLFVPFLFLFHEEGILCCVPVMFVCVRTRFLHSHHVHTRQTSTFQS